MRNSIELLADHIIVILIIKDYSNCIIVEKVIVIMQDNREEMDLVQKININKANRLESGESIFFIFL